MLFFFSSAVQANTIVATLYTPIAYSMYTTKVVYYLDVLTPESVNHGSYKPEDSYGIKSGWLENISWTGPGTPPSLKLISMTKISKSSCPGLDEFDSRSDKTDWTCFNTRIEVWKEDSSVHGCPWLVSTHADSYMPTSIDPGPGTYSDLESVTLLVRLYR